MLGSIQIKQGEKTKTIYTWIKEGNYKEAILALDNELYSNPNSRAALSLLAYCYYTTQDFFNAAQCYNQLSELFPQDPNYLLNNAKCLFQIGDYDKTLNEAYRFSEKYENQEKNLLANKNNDKLLIIELLKLQAAIKYMHDEDVPNAKLLIDQISDGNIDKEANLGCLFFKEKQYEKAIEKFSNCLQMENLNLSNTRVSSNQILMKNSNGSEPVTIRNNSIINRPPDLLYNMAVCYYNLKNYSEASKYIGEIIEQGIREHPELSVGMNTEDLEVRSVGNTEVLNESVLVEAFNLKAAIEYQMKNFDAAKEALTDMPPRCEEELDAVTLHNIALISIDFNPIEGFEKLQFLLKQDSFPHETFSNLLLLFCRHDYFELAADLMAENAPYTYKYLSPYLYEFLDALITQQTSPEDAYQKFDEIAAKHIDALRKLKKQLQETNSKISESDDPNVTNEQKYKLKQLNNSFEERLELYIPVLMAQAKIYWDLECYTQVEKVFRKSAEFCSELDVWKLNVAHVLFMHENKFKEAAALYEQLVKKNYDKILNVSAIVLANLCVSYIMTGQNEDAEELMRKIEKEEEQLIYSDPDQKVFHLCIVNLVIGTLYCSKGNYEFGISRVIKSLDPYQKKLGTDTWFYAKRCFLAMLENLAKQVIVIRDSVLQECLQFLTMCEQYGQNIKAIIEAPLELDTLHPGKNTVTYESRLLKTILLEIIEG